MNKVSNDKIVIVFYSHNGTVLLFYLIYQVIDLFKLKIVSHLLIALPHN